MRCQGDLRHEMLEIMAEAAQRVWRIRPASRWIRSVFDGFRSVFDVATEPPAGRRSSTRAASEFETSHVRRWCRWCRHVVNVCENHFGSLGFRRKRRRRMWSFYHERYLLALAKMYYNQELGLCIEFGPVRNDSVCRGGAPPCAGSRRHGLLPGLLVIACYLSFIPSSLK